MPPNQPFQPYPVPVGMPPSMPNSQSANSKKPRRWGLIIALVIFVILFIAASVFGIWAFAERQDYKFNSDIKAAKAVEIAKQQESTRKDNEFLEKEKSPLKTYFGPEAYGSLNISYSKIWSAYVVQTDRSALPLDIYFHPNFVPGIQQTGLAFALRVQIVNQPYDQELKQHESKVTSGKVSVKPYVPKNVPSVAGSRLDGEINLGQKNSMVLLPLRDKTLKISTESQQFVGDFDTIILENLKFIP
ncbi:MAG: hypothetical protein V4702_04210 [Patescibacteria group bacterium]